MPRGRLIISYRTLEEILHLPEGSRIQWAEEEFHSPSFIVYVDHPNISKVKPGQLFPEVILKTKDGENWEYEVKNAEIATSLRSSQ